MMRTSPYGVHTDYIFGGLTAKRNRLREAQIWLDAPSYYSSPRLLQVQHLHRTAQHPSHSPQKPSCHLACLACSRCCPGDFCKTVHALQVDIHVPAVPDNFERLRSDYMVELHLKVMQHQLDQVALGIPPASQHASNMLSTSLPTFCLMSM